MNCRGRTTNNTTPKNQQSVVDEDLGIALPGLAPPDLQRCQEQDQTTTKSPSEPISLLVTLVLYPSVVTMSLYHHSAGEHIKSNTAAVSCALVVINRVNITHHCRRCAPTQANHDVSRTDLVIVLLLYEGLGERFSTKPRCDPVRRLNQLCTMDCTTEWKEQVPSTSPAWNTLQGPPAIPQARTSPGTGCPISREDGTPG